MEKNILAILIKSKITGDKFTPEQIIKMFDSNLFDDPTNQILNLIYLAGKLQGVRDIDTKIDLLE